MARTDSPTAIELVAIIRARMDRDSPLLNQMSEVQRRVNGEWTLPYLTSKDSTGDDLPNPAPTIIADAVDNNAVMAASVLPTIGVPAIRGEIETGRGSREWADIRRKALYATWDASRVRLMLRRAFRHYFGYATTAMRAMPVFDSRNGGDADRVGLTCVTPLSAYPDERTTVDFSTPVNCAFVYTRSAAYLRSAYPQVADLIDEANEDLWHIGEWVDEHNTVMLLMGPVTPYFSPGDEHGMRYVSELSSWPTNCGGLVPVVTPARVTLDRLASQVSSVTGVTDLLTQLMQLEVLSVEKAVFPDLYMVGGKGRTPRLASNDGEWADGRTGKINIVEDADSIGQLNTVPPPQVGLMQDRLERVARQGTDQVPQQQGETYGALRTGRGIDKLTSIAIDPHMQEAHEVMEAALEDLNRVSLELYRGWWPNRKFTMSTGSATALDQFEFEPSKHVEISDNVVSYAIPGADANGITIVLGQTQQTGNMSKRTFRVKSPLIDDPDAEQAMIDEEDLEAAVKESLIRGVSAGEIPLVYLSKIEKHRKTEPDIFRAIEAADAELREEQATPDTPPEGEQIVSPDAVPGLQPTPEMAQMPAPPGSEALAGPVVPGALPPVPPGEPGLPAVGPTEDQAGLKRLINTLLAGQSQVPG